MKIELKSIKYSALASEETNYFRAALWIDGKRVGHVSNDGHGGCDMFHGDREAYKKADDWCKANLPKWSLPDFSNQETETDLEHHYNDILETVLATRELKRALKTKVLFHDPETKSTYEVKHGGLVEKVVDEIISQRPGVTILNTLPLEQAVALYRS